MALLVVPVGDLLIILLGILCYQWSGSWPRNAVRSAKLPRISRRQADVGIKNVEKLLPLAKGLTLKSLKDLATDYGITASELQRAGHNIDGVQRVVLDARLDDMAEVDTEAPTEIHIGLEYAQYLSTNEETVLLLGHELTHLAASDDNLKRFIEMVAENAEREAKVHPSDEQKEDLACDFIAEQALKRYILQDPSDESVAQRFSRAFDYDNKDSNEGGDEEHLGEGATLRALIGLDPELRGLILNN